MATLTQTLEFILKAIAPNPDKVQIESIQENGLTVLTLILPQEDLGQIIGKNGRIIKSVRTLLSLSHPQERYNLVIRE